MKFPGIAARFPERGTKSADFGQNLQNSRCGAKKFAAKFPEAGNFEWPSVYSKLSSVSLFSLTDSREKCGLAKRSRAVADVGLAFGAFQLL